MKVCFWNNHHISTWCPVFAAFNYYDKGAGDALVQLARRFVAPAETTQSKAINLLGATPLDFSTNGDVKACRALFEQAGYTVLADFAMHSTLDDIARSSSAAANVVLSTSGLPLARWFKKEFGTPYICGVPVGVKGAEALLAQLEATLTAAPLAQEAPTGEKNPRCPRPNCRKQHPLRP